MPNPPPASVSSLRFGFGAYVLCGVMGFGSIAYVPGSERMVQR